MDKRMKLYLHVLIGTVCIINAAYIVISVLASTNPETTISLTEHLVSNLPSLVLMLISGTLVVVGFYSFNTANKIHEGKL